MPVVCREEDIQSENVIFGIGVYQENYNDEQMDFRVFSWGWWRISPQVPRC